MQQICRPIWKSAVTNFTNEDSLKYINITMVCHKCIISMYCMISILILIFLKYFLDSITSSKNNNKKMKILA